MNAKIWLIAATVWFFFSGYAQADARLDRALSLSHEQAAQVNEIQKKYRQEFSAVRQDFNRERRRLMRAENDHDTALIAEQEKKTANLQDQLKKIKASEDAEIRKLLNADQVKAFEAYIEKRNAMTGSSRDAKLYR
jgi:predicted phage gp36 major capsid-like protein